MFIKERLQNARKQALPVSNLFVFHATRGSAHTDPFSLPLSLAPTLTKTKTNFILLAMRAALNFGYATHTGEKQVGRAFAS